MKKLYFLLLCLVALPAMAQQDLAITALDPVDGDSVISQMTFNFEVANTGNTTIPQNTNLFVEFVGITGSLTNTTPFTVNTTRELTPGDKDTLNISVNWNANPPITFDICLWLLGASGDYDLSGGVNYGGIANVLTNDPTPADNETCMVITIIDNAAPTDITLSPDTVQENQSPGITVGYLDATDADTADQYSFELVPGQGGQDNSSFLISGDVMITTEVFDYETKSVYHCRVKATDINYGYTYTKIMTINVTDVEETTSLSELTSGVRHLSVSPNPAAEFSRLDLSDFGASNFQLEIYSTDGRLVRSETVFDQHLLRRDDLPDGMYILHLLRENELVAGSRWILSH